MNDGLQRVVPHAAQAGVIIFGFPGRRKVIFYAIFKLNQFEMQRSRFPLFRAVKSTGVSAAALDRRPASTPLSAQAPGSCRHNLSDEFSSAKWLSWTHLLLP